MKRFLIIILIILLAIIAICSVAIGINSNTNMGILKQNEEYEQYFKNETYGTDIITLINKATDSNEKNNVEKNEKGLFINNNLNSIIIDLVMITNEEKMETTTYRMEAISKVGITEFIKNFNTVQFECTKIEYHKKTGKIAYIELTQKTV